MSVPVLHESEAKELAEGDCSYWAIQDLIEEIELRSEEVPA